MKQRRRIRQPWWKGEGVHNKKRRREKRRTRMLVGRERRREAARVGTISLPKNLSPVQNPEGMAKFLKTVKALPSQFDNAVLQAEQVEQVDIPGLVMLSGTLDALNEKGSNARRGRGWKVTRAPGTAPGWFQSVLEDFGVFGYRRGRNPLRLDKLGVRALPVRSGRGANAPQALRMLIGRIL